MAKTEQKIEQIQFKRGSKAALIANLTIDKMGILAKGEPAFEIDTGQLKIGNGIQNYVDLPYVGAGGGSGGFDPRIVIQNPDDGQILIYDQPSQKWVNKDMTDAESIIYLAERGLTIKGYETATPGQMLVKDSISGLSWQNPVSITQLNEAVEQAEASKIAAGNYSVTAGNSASAADTSARTAQSINTQTMNWINQKFWWGTAEEYNALTSISPGTFYFITAE